MANLSTIAKCTLPTRQRDPVRENGTFLYVDIASINRESKQIEDAKETPCDQAPSRARKEIKTGDVIVSTVRPNLNAVAQVPTSLDNQIASTGFAVLRPNPSLVAPRYLFYRVVHPAFIEDMAAQAKGAGYPAVSDRIVGAHAFPLPPLPEQHRIVEILDQADALRKQRRHAAEVSQKILPALFHEMFGDLSSNDRNLPKSRIADISFRITKGESPKWQGFGYQSSGVLFVTSENVRMGFLDIDSPKFIPHEFHSKLLRSQIQYDDLLINLVGASIGRPCIFSRPNTPANVNQAVAVVTLDHSKILPEFALAQIMSAAGQQNLLGNRVEGARANISLANIRDFMLFTPSLELQKRFAAAAAVFNATTHHQETNVEKIETLFQTLLHRAFDGTLTAKWREGHTKDLLQEMEHQTKV